MCGTVDESREACSHLSCKSCAEKMEIEKVHQITPTVPKEKEDKRCRFKRDYVKGLWLL